MESFFKDVLVEWGVINVKIIIPKKRTMLMEVSLVSGNPRDPHSFFPEWQVSSIRPFRETGPHCLCSQTVNE